MQCPEKVQHKPFVKRLYTSPSTGNFSKIHKYPESTIPKQTRVRRTDHTSEKNSEEENNRQGADEGYEEYVEGHFLGDSGVFGNIKNEETGFKFIGSREEKVVELRERLKNLHHFYRVRIEEERSKNIERNEIFIGIIEELQKSHNEKIIVFQKSLEEMEEEKREIVLVDDRMGTIKNTIEDILKQSQELKTNNEELQNLILEKETSLKEKENRYMELKDEVYGMNEKLEQFELLKLKENKRNKEMIEMIDHAF